MTDVLEKAPVASVEADATLLPSKVIETALDAGKFEPEMEVAEPTVPLADVSETVGVLIVKVAVSVLLAASVNPANVGPEAAFGTVKVAAEKLPFESVFVVPLSGRLAPPNVALTLDEPAKPEPDTETFAPATPAVGASVILGVTTKVALADCPLAVTVTVCPPAVVAGTENDTGLTPPLPVIGVVATATPSKVTEAEARAGKPDPETETESPTWPVEGVSVTVPDPTLTATVAATEMAVQELGEP